MSLCQHARDRCARQTAMRVSRRRAVLFSRGDERASLRCVDVARGATRFSALMLHAAIELCCACTEGVVQQFLSLLAAAGDTGRLGRAGLHAPGRSSARRSRALVWPLLKRLVVRRARSNTRSAGFGRVEKKATRPLFAWRDCCPLQTVLLVTQSTLIEARESPGLAERGRCVCAQKGDGVESATRIDCLLACHRAATAAMAELRSIKYLVVAEVTSEVPDGAPEVCVCRQRDRWGECHTFAILPRSSLTRAPPLVPPTSD